MEGITDGTPLFIGAYPVAWRFEVVVDDKHRSFEYVRSELYVAQRIQAVYSHVYHSIFWGNTKSAWDLHFGQEENGTKVRCLLVPGNYT